jgi:hypothetical protein
MIFLPPIDVLFGMSMPINAAPQDLFGDYERAASCCLHGRNFSESLYKDNRLKGSRQSSLCRPFIKFDPRAKYTIIHPENNNKYFNLSREA